RGATQFHGRQTNHRQTQGGALGRSGLVPASVNHDRDHSPDRAPVSHFTKDMDGTKHRGRDRSRDESVYFLPAQNRSTCAWSRRKKITRGSATCREQILGKAFVNFRSTGMSHQGKIMKALLIYFPSMSARQKRPAKNKRWSAK